jgi:hypothetical protein
MQRGQHSIGEEVDVTHAPMLTMREFFTHGGLDVVKTTSV